MKNSLRNDSPYLVERYPSFSYYDKHKGLTSRTAGLLWHSELQAVSRALYRCGRIVAIGEYVDQNGRIHYVKLAEWRCKNRACYRCQATESRKRYIVMNLNLPIHFAKHPTAEYLRIDLTVKNCPPGKLSATIDLLQNAWNKMTQRVAWPGVGYVKTLEVTRNPDTGEAHPHFHAVVQVTGGYRGSKKYLSQEKLVQMWQEALGVEYEPSVRIRKVKPKDGQTGAEALQQEIVQAISYCLKASELTDDATWLVEVLPQLKHKRTVATGGKMKQLIKNSTLKQIEEALEPGIELTRSEFKYDSSEERYKVLETA